MVADPGAPPEIRALGHEYMSGIPSPDLSGLPEELVQVVRRALAG